jgi:Na+/H+-translocating membrane pyrophosphatase
VSSEPSESNSDDPFEKGVIALRDAIERNIDRASHTAAQLDRTLISLSAGALLLSITFVPSLAPKKLWLLLLFLAWLSFVAAMIFVILAMRSEQNAAEKAIQKASTSLKQLEENPTRARNIIAQLQIQKPIVQKQITKNTLVARLNLCALMAFIIGVLCLATFAGYNLWRTPAEQIQSEHVR